MRSLRIYATILVVLTVSPLFAAGPDCSVGPAGSTYSTVQAALDDSGCLVISLAAGTYTENLVVTRQVEINGAGAATTILDGGGTNRVIDFSAAGNAELKLRGVTVRNGNASGNGGAIRTAPGRLVLEHVIVTGNTASGSGGGIALDTTNASISDSTISLNSASSGGGISMSGFGGALDLRRSLIASNQSLSQEGPGGGGILSVDMNDATISNSTISGNRSNSDGGALTAADFPFFQLTNVTVTNNSSNGIGGINTVFFFSLKNTIVSGNYTLGSSAASDCSGTPDAPVMMSFGNNILGSNGSLGNCPAGGMSDNVPAGDVNTVIAALADNGGQSLTHNLADGSVARDAGADEDTLGTDQRGPGFPRLRGPHVDIGALEMGTPPTANAGGPYNVNEGSDVNVSGTGAPFPEEPADLTFAWDLDNNGSFETEGSAATFSAATLDGPATHTIVFRVCDGEGECMMNSASVQVNNVAPSVTLSGATINEGETAFVSGTVTDASVSDSITVVISWGSDQDPTTLSLEAGVTTFSASKKYADDGSFDISAVATDDDGGSNTANAVVVVANVAPIVTAGPNITALTGVTVTATGAFSDAGVVDTASATVDWNDSSPIEPANVVMSNGSGSVSATHQYSRAGTYSISLCVADNDGAQNCATLTATITAPAPPPPPPPPPTGITGKITGGGLRTGNNGRGGFTIDNSKGELKGEFQFQNDDIKLHASEFTKMSIAEDRKSATFEGVSKSGVAFFVYVEDNGNGDNDIFKLWTGAAPDLGGVLQTAEDGRLSEGNIQIHKK